MNKPLLLVTVLFLATLASISLIPNANADSVQWWRWSGETFSGTDTFYDATVKAFEEGTMAVLFVSVINDFPGDIPINVSAVKVGFDWGLNYSSTQTSAVNPVVMQPDEIRVFTVSFVVPNASESASSNLYLHDYKIYVEHLNATTGPKKLSGTWVKYSYTVTYYFAIYSADQADAQKAKQLIAATPTPSFNSTKAMVLWDRADNESNIADMFYSNGDFDDAMKHYDNALVYMEQAYTAEDTKGTSFENAELAVLEAQARSLDASASYLNGLGSMWVLIGVAAVLFAIGYIIRGFAHLRKPTPTT